MATADGASSPNSSSKRRLDGKVAIITGGASGIGEATAKFFVSHGARVVIADVQDEKGRMLCELLGSPNASYVHCDITCESDVERTVAAAVSEHGRLDIMFSNAGIVDLRDGGILNCEKSVFERVMATNVVGAMLAIKHTARAMVPESRGSIVVTASVVTSPKCPCHVDSQHFGDAMTHTYITQAYIEVDQRVKDIDTLDNQKTKERWKNSNLIL